MLMQNVHCLFWNSYLMAYWPNRCVEMIFNFLPNKIYWFFSIPWCFKVLKQEFHPKSPADVAGLKAKLGLLVCSSANAEPQHGKNWAVFGSKWVRNAFGSPRGWGPAPPSRTPLRKPALSDGDRQLLQRGAGAPPHFKAILFHFYGGAGVGADRPETCSSPRSGPSHKSVQTATFRPGRFIAPR